MVVLVLGAERRRTTPLLVVRAKSLSGSKLWVYQILAAFKCAPVRPFKATLTHLGH